MGTGRQNKPFFEQNSLKPSPRAVSPAIVFAILPSELKHVNGILSKNGLILLFISCFRLNGLELEKRQAEVF